MRPGNTALLLDLLRSLGGTRVNEHVWQIDKGEAMPVQTARLKTSQEVIDTRRELIRQLHLTRRFGLLVIAATIVNAGIAFRLAS